MIALLSLAFAVESTTLDVSWNKNHGEVRIAPPVGEHVAPDSSVWVQLEYGGRTVTNEFASELGADPIPANGIRGQTVTGTVRAPICRDDGTECRMVTVNVAGVVPGTKKGTVRLAAAAPESVVSGPASSPFNRDASEDIALAMAEAQASGRPLLLDFSAVWCPPCNLLAAEVFHAPDAEMALSDVLVVVIDVDDSSSWGLKDRYHVDAYPTIVAVNGDGTEIDRLFGYDNREATFAWIADVSDGEVTSYLPQMGPDEVAPDVAARTALTLIQSGRSGWEPWLARANEDDSHPDVRIARLHAEPTFDDARWLLDNHPDTASDWVFAAMPLSEAHPELLQQAAGAAMTQATGPIDKADLLYVMAKTSPSPLKEALYAGAARTLRSGFVGDSSHDRAHVTFLATLYAGAGEIDEAIDLLDSYEARFPDEPTWDMQAASLLLDADQLDRALTRSTEALQLAWGDIALRAAKTHAEILMALGRDADAHASIDQILAAQPIPAEGSRVRTHHYRAELIALRDGETDAQ